jgi:hypothetical protein
MKEKRTYPRVEKNCLFVLTSDQGAIIANMIDISESGLQMANWDNRLAVGQQVRLTFSPSVDELYTESARVVRSDEYSIALSFEGELDSESLARAVAA